MLLANGRRAGGRPPYGWMNIENPDGPGMVLAQDPDRINFVSEAAVKALTGESLYAITRWMDIAGAPKRDHANRKHDHWAEASVEAILRNPVLAGMTPYAPGRKPGQVPKPSDVVRGKDGLPVVDESVAVLTPAEWRQLLENLDAAKRPGSRPKASKVPTLLAGLVKCGTCGSNMHRARVGGKYESYRCGNRDCDRKAGINLPQLEEYVTTRVLKERGGEFLMKVEVSHDCGDLTEIEAAIRDTTAQMQEDNADMAALGQRLANLKEARAQSRQGATRVHTVQDATVLRKAWVKADTTEGRRKLLTGHLAGVVIQPGDKTRNRFDTARVSFDWQRSLHEESA